MKRFFNWTILFGLILIVLSVAFYLLHYWIFRDVHHIFLYLIGDVAFLFIDVLIVALVLQRLLVYREKQAILKKLNMVIGTFFSEVGTELLAFCAKYDNPPENTVTILIVTPQWSKSDFENARKALLIREPGIGKVDFAQLKHFIVNKRSFLLSLLENPNLLEHERFTNLLWAVFHLADELSHRKHVNQLSDSDEKHLTGDIKRVYNQLLIQWLAYIEHLKRDYPYLFSLAIRTNPFDPNASVEVK
jgi:hypothetical protein